MHDGSGSGKRDNLEFGREVIPEFRLLHTKFLKLKIKDTDLDWYTWVRKELTEISEKTKNMNEKDLADSGSDYLKDLCRIN
jgi:hypothetical protein